MAIKFELLNQLYAEQLKKISSSPSEWMSFLFSSCRNYKLNFDELVLLYAQRPDAVAVLEFQKWNKFGRRIKAGSKGIAVFDKEISNATKIKYYFDISDTYPTEYSKPVPIWSLKGEYVNEVIKGLEKAFGKLSDKSSILTAVISATEILIENNIEDYTNSFISDKENSSLEKYDDVSLLNVYKDIARKSILYTLCARLGLDVNSYFSIKDFENIKLFDTSETIKTLGLFTRDVSEIGLAEIAKIILPIESKNRTFDNSTDIQYNLIDKTNHGDERSRHNGNHLYSEGQHSDTEPYSDYEQSVGIREMVGREGDISQGTQEGPLLTTADLRRTRQASPRSSEERRTNGRDAYETDERAGRLDGGVQDESSNRVGSGDEQPQEQSSGNNLERDNLHISSPFTDETLILKMLNNPDDDLVHHKDFIVEQHGKLSSEEFSQYVSTLYGEETKEFEFNGIFVGYERNDNGLLMYEGKSELRTKESVFSWGIIAELIAQLIDNGEYLPTKEEKVSEDLQISLFAFANDEADYDDSQISLFTPTEIPQQIIDEAICLGTHDKDSKLKITAYLKKDKPIDDNVTFIKKEYKDFASGFMFEDKKVSVLAVDTGFKINMGSTANSRSATFLSWTDVAKRIRELLEQGRYMPQLQLDNVAEYERRTIAESLIFMTRDIAEPYRDTYMTFVNGIRNDRSSYADKEKELADKLKEPENLAMVIDDLSVYINALEENSSINRFPKLYRPNRLLSRLYDLQLPQLNFTAQPGVPEVPSRFISEDEISWLLRNGRTDDRLWYYSLYKTESDAHKRESEIKNYHGLSGIYDGKANISADGKGYTLSRGDSLEPYAKITLKWNEVEKRIGKMIANGTFLTDKDKAYMPTYEKQHIAREVQVFFSDTSNDYPKSFNYSNEDDILPVLDSPEAVETIYNEMLNVIKDMKEDDRHYEIRHTAFEEFSQYREGTFTLFGEKKEPKLIYNDISFSLPSKDKNNEVDVLYRILNALKIDDISIDTTDNGSIIAWDNVNEWKGVEFYHFLIDEAFVFTEKGVLGVKPDVFEAFSEWASKYNIKVEAPKFSPLYTDYMRVEAENIGNIVFYQVGDFYEAMGDSAKLAASELDLVLTGRDVGKSDRIALCGFPIKSLDDYLNRLTNKGYTVTVSSLKNNGERIEITYSSTNNKNIIDKALHLINEYHKREFNDYNGADYNTLDEIGLAFTETEDGVHTIEVFADIINKYSISVLVDGKLFDERSYATLEELIDKELYGLEFMDLVYLDEEKLNNFLGISQEKETMQKPYITCEWSESSVFEDGKIYSVAEFDSLMRQADENRILGKNSQIEKYGSEAAWYEAMSNAREGDENYPDVFNFAGYDKVKFTLTMPDGKTYTERQDIGDGDGGVIDFLKMYPSYDEIVPVLEELVRNENPDYFTQKEEPVERNNFNLTDFEVETVGKKERFRRNMEAIRVLKECEFDNRYATPEEQKILAQYVGWGGIPEAFDENNNAWADECKELIVALSPDEYDRARESTLTAFYTPPVVIKAIYNYLDKLGFKNGNILEPSCAIGNFIGMLPESMSDSKVYGVELDSVSANIAKQLYQKADIINAPFEKTNYPDNFFDVAIGNVPFGDFKVIDKRYDKNNFLIHDYFFAKALDKVRPGGIVAFITAKGTMDKKDTSVRRYLAQRADLIGAVRLPDNTFAGNAGTRVTSDIILLQKRDKIILDAEPEWMFLDTNEDGIEINRYFCNHPDMILGKMVAESGRFGMQTNCKEVEGAELTSLLTQAAGNITGRISENILQEALDEVNDDVIPASPEFKNFSYALIDGEIFYRNNDVMERCQKSDSVKSRIKGMIELRDCVHNLIDLQLTNASDNIIQDEQVKLNSLYDNYTKEFGLINSKENEKAFDMDDSYYLLSSLEVLEDGKLLRKADIFTKRTILPHIPVTHVDSSSEALAISIGERAYIDIPFMSELTGKDENTLYKELQGVIFINPLKDLPNENKYLMADEYLSGNVREKLETAQKMAEVYPEYQPNVEALQKVQPKDLTAGEISVRLGATWIPTKYIDDFIYELLNVSYYMKGPIKSNYSEYTNEWNISNKSYDRFNIKATTTYGTQRVNAYKIIETTLNLRDVQVFDYDTDENGKRVAKINIKETQIAQSKQELIKQAFKDWIWKNPTPREELCRIYNDKFNSIRPREYDGSHLTFSGMNSNIKLRPHQLNAIAHILYGGNTLLAHTVGAGKTYEMIAASMKLKQMGLCSKSMFVVPNHLTRQWANEFLTLYPSANILVATKKDFETNNRKTFCSRIATGNYDAVIIGHSQFEKIPVSYERQAETLNYQIEEIIRSIEDAKANAGQNFTVKQLEKTKKDLQKRLDKLNSQERKDNVVNFEELGVDRIFVDESHYFKNLFLYTKMRNISGVAQSEAQKSSDLFMKCRYLDELTNGRGTVFATGTPVSNSMVELYTVQRYLQYDTLKKHGLATFDAWASTFGETVSALELKPEGTGYRPKTRFARFFNLPELMSMVKEVADIQTADMLNLPVPTAHYNTISTKPSEIQKNIVESLSERADLVRNGDVEAYVDNMLKITNDGRKLALDQRLIDNLLPDYENSKINACVNAVVDFYEKGKDNKLTQLLFCDLSTPKGKESDSASVLFTDVYHDIKNKLVARGIPEQEIEFIHNADTEKKKEVLFEKVNRGDVRVLLGSTQKMGAGTNVQERLIAIHDLDCPWRPSDLEQRAGRIIRQGNSNSDVYINRYVTENTFDAYLYQIIETKQKFISQIFTSKSPTRTAEDIDEAALSYAEIKMLATGDPHIKEKMELDLAVSKLQMLKSSFLSEKYDLEDKTIKYYPAEISRLTAKIEGLKTDIKMAADNPASIGETFVGMTIFDKLYKDKKEAGLALLNACHLISDNSVKQIGSYRGFDLSMCFDSFSSVHKVILRGQSSHTVEIGASELGNITRLDNALDGLEKELNNCTLILEKTYKELEDAKIDSQREFPQEAELQEKLSRLAELNAELKVNERTNQVYDTTPSESDNEPKAKQVITPSR